MTEQITTAIAAEQDFDLVLRLRRALSIGCPRGLWDLYAHTRASWHRRSVSAQLGVPIGSFQAEGLIYQRLLTEFAAPNVSRAEKSDL